MKILKSKYNKTVIMVLAVMLSLLLMTISVCAGEQKDTLKIVGTPLLQFCNDQELNEWFDSLETDFPESMEYWIFGEAPYAMEFTDPELIMAAAKALKTVKIGNLSDFDPDNVADAEGNSFCFRMKDGSSMILGFTMGTFSWNGSPSYVVADYGDLQEICSTLSDIGNPDYIDTESEDGGFYTNVNEKYRTDWEEESSFFGGIRIYPEYQLEIPFISAARCEGETDPEQYLLGDAQDELKEALEEYGWTVRDQSEIEDYEYYWGRIVVPGILYNLEDPKDGDLQLLVLAIPMEDDYLGQDHVMRVCAVCPGTALSSQEPSGANNGFIFSEKETMQDRVLEAIDMTVRNLDLEYMNEGKMSVQPGMPLFEFCNHEGLNAWLEDVLDNPPAELVYTSDRWHAISDPDDIRTVLDALQTVVIGDISDAHVGGSGRQIFDFIDENGDPVSFMFFQNTFDWDGEQYEVLDWGELEDLDIIAMEE